MRTKQTLANFTVQTNRLNPWRTLAKSSELSYMGYQYTTHVNIKIIVMIAKIKSVFLCGFHYIFSITFRIPR